MSQSGHFLPGNPTFSPVAPRSSAVSAVADIPRKSPLATGWRAALAQALEQHGLHEVLDAISAYAELRNRHERDWYNFMAAPSQRRIEDVAELTPRGPGRPRLEE